MKMKMIFLSLSIVFLFLETNPWMQAAQIGVDIVGGIAKGIAEAKLKNNEIKRENIELYKKISSTGENSKVQINNLFLVSNIKEDFSQRVNDYKDNHLINLDDMNLLISNLYRNYISLSKQFVAKCNGFLRKGNNVLEESSLMQTLIKISIVAIKSAFLEYISLLQSYNFESQNLVQIMLTNNLKENIFQKINVKNNLIDPHVNLSDFLDKFDFFLDKNDGTIGDLLTSKKLLQDNIILTFNKQTKAILETLEKIEEQERTKEIINDSFVDITDSLDILKEKLFGTFDNVDESTNNLENFLFKMIFIFQINMNKLQIMVEFMNKFEDKKFSSEEDFLSSLKKEFIKNKNTIMENKERYVQVILQYKKPLEFFKNINNFFSQAKKDLKKMDNSSFRSMIREYSKLILEQELAYGKFVEKIKDQSSELFYMNGAIADLDNTIEKIREEKEQLIREKLNKPQSSALSESNNLVGEDLGQKDLKQKDIVLVNNMTIINKDKIGRHERRDKKSHGKSVKRESRKARRNIKNNAGLSDSLKNENSHNQNASLEKKNNFSGSSNKNAAHSSEHLSDVHLIGKKQKSRATTRATKNTRAAKNKGKKK